MNKYLKHQSSLLAKRESKRRKLERSQCTEGPVDSFDDSQQSGVSVGDSGSLGGGSPAQFNPIGFSQVDYVNSISSMDSRWNEKFERFQASFSEQMKESLFSMFNQFASSFHTAPNQVPADCSRGMRATGPSPSDPHQGEGPGVKRVEQVLGVVPSSIPSIPVSVASLGHGSQGVTGSSLGTGSGVNLGASGSGLGQRIDPDFSGKTGLGGTAGAHSRIDVDEVEIDEDLGSLGHPGARTEQGEQADLAGLGLDYVEFNQLFNFVVQFFPQARLETTPSVSKSAITEGIYQPATPRVNERDRFTRLERFEELRTEVQEDVNKLEIGQKSFRGLLKADRGSYQIAGDSCDHSPKINPSFARLIAPNKVIGEKAGMSVPLDEMRKVETSLISAQESQSFSMWLLAALLSYIKNAGFVPPDVAMFERLCSSITSAQVRTSERLQRLQAFSVLNRRKTYLSHAPPSLGDEAKRELLASPIFSQNLFDENTLLETIARHQGDVSTTANQQLVKTVNKVLPSLLDTSKKRRLDSSTGPGLASAGSPLTDPRASTSATLASSVGGRGSYNRGRGRGGRGRGFGGRDRVVTKGSGNFKRNFQN